MRVEGRGIFSKELQLVLGAGGRCINVPPRVVVGMPDRAPTNRALLFGIAFNNRSMSAW